MTFIIFICNTFRFVIILIFQIIPFHTIWRGREILHEVCI